MDNVKYYKVLDEIISDGRGHDAIIKLALMLERNHDYLMHKFLIESEKNAGRYTKENE